jgi:hypothetical protein
VTYFSLKKVTRTLYDVLGLLGGQQANVNESFCFVRHHIDRFTTANLSNVEGRAEFKEWLDLSSQVEFQ